MVPILSRRSIVILVVGLVVGLLIAFGYWLVSPAFISTDDETGVGGADSTGTGTGLLGFLGIETGGPYRSTVSIQIVNPGSTYLSLSFLQQLGEYYAAKENTLPFYEFLSQELEKYPLETAYTIDELRTIIKTEYDLTSELPSIKVSATADTEEEAAFFAELAPQAFLDYLIAEEKEKRDKEYNNTLEELETVKEALYEAQQELNTLKSPDILDNPSYISLSAKVNALQQEFDSQLSLLTLEYYGDTDIKDEYENTLQEIDNIVAELIKAEQDLRAASGQDSSNLSDNANILLLESKIRGLKSQLDLLISGDGETIGLSQYISNGISSGTAYDNLVAQIEITAESLAEAKQEYDELVNSSVQQSTVISLEQRIAQIKVDTLSAELTALQEKLATLYKYIIDLNNEDGSAESRFNTISLALNDAKKELETLEKQLGYDRLYADMELMIAEDRVSNYNDRIADLNEQLGSLLSNNVESLETGYLVVGNPSIPFVVLPERSTASTTLLMGAIAGVIVAWIAMNSRWFINVVFKSGSAKPEDDED